MRRLSLLGVSGRHRIEIEPVHFRNCRGQYEAANRRPDPSAATLT
jgi:hypothetical protein